LLFFLLDFLSTLVFVLCVMYLFLGGNRRSEKKNPSRQRSLVSKTSTGE